MVLRRATSLRGALEGVGPKKSWFSGPTPSNAHRNDVAALKTIKYKRHKNNRYIGSFMYPSAVVYFWCVLLCVRGGGEVSLQQCCVSCEELLRGGGGWQASLSPSHYTVGIHGWMLVGGVCYSYIGFDTTYQYFPTLTYRYIMYFTMYN